MAVELIVTILRMRAPGMSLNRIPLFCWSMLVQSFMVIFAMPAVMIASTVMLLNDRTIGTHFVNPAEGGDPLLYQHVFWFFGHPEVYIIFHPGAGIGFVDHRSHIRGAESSVIRPWCCRWSRTAFIAFGLWVHHMFATGLPQIGEAYFTAASMMIAITSGVQIFCWLATLWTGRLRMTAAMHFVFGFIFIFVMGGMTGVMLASIPLDLQAHDTFFVVAHFHYVLIGGALFPLFGAFHHWFPKFTGRMIGREARQAFVLDSVRRLQLDVLPDAHSGAERHDAPHLHVSRRRWDGATRICWRHWARFSSRSAASCSSSMRSRSLQAPA